MDNNHFEKVCKDFVIRDLNNNSDIEQSVTEDEVFIVWSCKTLQNNKALVSSKIPNSPYYEITHNGDKNETYVDIYKKISNICF